MLPDHFHSRAATWDDAQAVADLINACDIALTGEAETDVDEVRTDWQDSAADLEHGTWVVIAPDGQLVGYESCEAPPESGRIFVDGYVHPSSTGQSIGTFLLRQAESRASEHIAKYPADAQVVIHASVYAHEEAAHRLFEAEGYHHIRRFWRMQIDMTEQPPAPIWPAGIQIRAYVQGQDDRAVYEAVDEAFHDHWGHYTRPFEDWMRRMTEVGDFDPALWFLAIDSASGEIAGASLCNYQNQKPWLRSLSVRRPWRRHGLGMALLLHTFNEFYQRDYRTVGLGVDAQNISGATALYERAGMHVVRAYDTFEKELRAGIPAFKSE